MSAYDAVMKAQKQAQEAQNAFEAQRRLYEEAVNNAARAIIENRLVDAQKELDAIGFSKEGESLTAYQKLWGAAVEQKDWASLDPLDTSKWRFVRDIAPIEATTQIEGFFGRGVLTGSSEIISDLAAVYDKAAENWHYNWDAAQMFNYKDSLAEEQGGLKEKLKSINVLIDEGSTARRLSGVMVKLCDLAKNSGELNLSNATLEAIDKTYVAVMERHKEEGHKNFLYPDWKHLTPPDCLPDSLAKFKELQEEEFGAKPTRPLPTF
jgi:hypothetical protein